MQDVDAQETAAQETTPGEAERCFPFDLMESYYCVGIILDFQKFMQFDVRGKLYQCSALPFKWNDSPRIFVNFMKVLAEVLPSPIAIRDRQDLWRHGSTRLSPRPPTFFAKLLQSNERLGTSTKLAAFNGLCQSVYLGVPAATLYLRELYFVLAKKRRSGAKVDRMEDLEVSNTGEDAHGAFSLRVGVVLNLKLEARGFWRDERHLQFMHLEIEAVFKTPQVFLHELRGRWCGSTATTRQRWRCWCHFTSRNPELMRRMQRLWSLLDLNDIESLASYIHSKANEVADHLSRDTNLDDWKLNRRWVDSLVYDWGGENNWINPPRGLLNEVGHSSSETMGAMVTERMWLLAKHACTYVALTIVSFGRPDTGMLLLQENAFMEGVKMVLTQEKCKNHQRKKPQLSFHWWGVERPWELLKLWMWCGMRPDTVQSRGGPINRCAGQLLAAAEGTSLTDTDTDTDTDLANEWLQQAGNVGSVHPKGEGIFPLTPPGRGLRSVPVLWVW
eukprot:gene8948-biopygen9114